MYLRLLIIIFLSSAVFSEEALPIIDHPEFPSSEISIRLPDVSFNPELPKGNYWLKSDNNVYMPSYEGLRRVAYGVVDKCFSRLYKECLSNTLENSDIYLPSEVSGLSLRSSAYYAWWDRSVLDSLTVEQGGARIIPYTVGRRIKIFSIGIISLYNDGKIQFNDWDIQLSHDSDKLWQPAAPYVDLESAERLFRINVERPYKRSRQYWRVSGSVNLNVRIDSISENKSSIKASVRVYCPLLAIKASASFQPFREAFAAKLSVTLLSF